jgi:hypothetical protein
MNKVARMIVQDKLSKRGTSSGNDFASRDSEMDRRMRDSYADGYKAGYDRANYEIRGKYDGENDEARRRSKTTGRYMKDRAAAAKLSDADIMHWESKLRNADGTHGKHFDMHQVQEAASRLGIHFDNYSEKEFCMAMNMLYSDFCEVCRAMVSPEKEAYHYAKMAKAWLEDEDGPPPAEKLALYYYCIADEDE